MEEKVKALNLLPLSEAMHAYLKEEFPMAYRSLIFAQEKGRHFEFVKFRRCIPEYFSMSYLESHSIEELLKMEEKRNANP
jgi:hypothetical protein